MEGFFPEKFLDDSTFWDESLQNQTDFLQSSDITEFGQESSQNVLNSNEGDLVQYSDVPVMKSGLRQENSCCNNMKEGNSSAFVQYRELPRTGHGEGSSNDMNMRKRMIGYLTKSCSPEKSNMAEYERERGFRHMINERMRRQRQRQCCLALHSMLPFGTKNDVNSVVQMAAKEIKRLEYCREELKKQNAELEEKLKGVEGNRIELKISHPPTSPLDSMLETLQLLMELGMNTKSITSNFSHQELFASLEIPANKEEAEVERGNEGAVNKNRWKLPTHDREISKRQRL